MYLLTYNLAPMLIAHTILSTQVTDTLILINKTSFRIVYCDISVYTFSCIVFYWSTFLNNRLVNRNKSTWKLTFSSYSECLWPNLLCRGMSLSCCFRSHPCPSCPQTGWARSGGDPWCQSQRSRPYELQKYSWHV